MRIISKSCRIPKLIDLPFILIEVECYFMVFNIYFNSDTFFWFPTCHKSGPFLLEPKSQKYKHKNLICISLICNKKCRKPSTCLEKATRGFGNVPNTLYRLYSNTGYTFLICSINLYTKCTF